MLFIRYESMDSILEPDPFIAWAWQDQSALQMMDLPCRLSELLSLLPASLKASLLHHVAIILPSEVVSLHSLELPQVHRKHLDKAIPYALEEKLAEDVENLHFAYKLPVEGKKIHVAVMTAELLKKLLAQLSHHQIYPIYMTSDAALLLEYEGVENLFIEDKKTFIRTSPDSVICVMTEQSTVFINEILSAPPLADDSSQMISFNSLCSEYHNQIVRRSLLDILQGAFKQNHRATSSRAVVWRGTVLLLLSVIVIKMGITAGEAIYYRHKADVLQQENVALYKTFFPHAKHLHNIKRELKAQLRAAQQGNDSSGFLLLLAKAGKPMAELKKSIALDIERISYEKSQLRVDISIENFPALEILKSALERAGLIVTIDAAHQDKARVKARIKLSE